MKCYQEFCEQHVNVLIVPLTFAHLVSLWIILGVRSTTIKKKKNNGFDEYNSGEMIMKLLLNEADVMSSVWCARFQCATFVLLPGFSVWGRETATAEPRPSGPDAGVRFCPDRGSRCCRWGRSQSGKRATGKNGLPIIASPTQLISFELNQELSVAWKMKHFKK